MSTTFNAAFLPKRDPRGRPFSATYRLWKQGHRINGKIAWRIRSREFALPYTVQPGGGRKLHHHAKYRAGRVWVNFTSEDFIYVRQGDGSDKKYYRSWWLPFLAQVWMASRFDLWGTFTRLRKWYGLRVGRNYGIRYLKAALYGHLPEIKEYVMATTGKNLDIYFQKFDKNIEFLEKVRDKEMEDAQTAKLSERLEASSTVGRDLAKIIAVFTEAKKKDETDAKQTDFQERLLTNIQDVKAALPAVVAGQTKDKPDG